MKKNFEKIIKITLFVLTSLCLSAIFVCCGGKGNDDSSVEVKTELSKWATETVETVNYYDYYYAPMDIVAVGSNEFLPAVKVTDSEGNGVPLVSDKFLVEDKDGYAVNYSIVFDGTFYEKRITLNTVIADPNIFVGEITDCDVGVEHPLPNIAVMENDGRKIDYSCKIFDPENNEVQIADGQFKTMIAGTHRLTVSAQGENGSTVNYETSFETFIPSVIYSTLVDTGNLVSKTAYVNGWLNSYKIGNVDDAQISAGKSYCIQLKCTSEPSSYLTFDIDVGDVSAYDHLEMKFWAAFADGKGGYDNYYPWHLKAGNSTGTDLFTTSGWRGWDNPVTVEIPVNAVVNNKLKLSFTQDYYGIGELYIQYIKGVYLPTFAVDIPRSIYTKTEISADDCIATYGIGEVVIAQNITVSSVKFNDETVALPFTPTEEGTLTLTYEYEDQSRSIDISVIREVVTLVDTTNLISKTTKVGGNATIGNVASPQIGGQGAYCIKLPEDYTNYYVTIDIDVGDVSDYDHLELKFWALGLQGDTWYVKAGGNDGTTLFTAGGWRSWDNPITIDIATSYVSNGKLRLTFTETWATGDELYIQYIKGVK